MRRTLLALSLGLISSGCEQPSEDSIPAPTESPAPLVNWASLSDDQVIVGEGVNYTVSDGAARILGVPQEAGAGGTTGGVGVQLPESFEHQASGNLVSVTVRASSADPDALLGVAYSTADVGNSGWQAFAVTPEPSDYTFQYSVPILQAGNGDFLGFRSYGDDSVVVYGFRVDVIHSGTTAAPQ